MPVAAATQPLATAPRQHSQVSTLGRDFEQLLYATRANLLREKFDELDALAAQLRASKERLRDGAWKLNAFYMGVGAPPDDDATDNGWESHLNNLRKWLSHSPDSITAHVALADALLNYAWEARGTGYSNTVTQEGRRLFNERMAMAGEVINDAGDRKSVV